MCVERDIIDDRLNEIFNMNIISFYNPTQITGNSIQLSTVVEALLQ